MVLRFDPAEWFRIWFNQPQNYQILQVEMMIHSWTGQEYLGRRSVDFQRGKVILLSWEIS